MGEILSRDILDLLKNDEFKRALRTLVESDEPISGGVPVDIETPEGEQKTVNLRIANA